MNGTFSGANRFNNGTLCLFTGLRNDIHLWQMIIIMSYVGCVTWALECECLQPQVVLAKEQDFQSPKEMTPYFLVGLVLH